jgi:hypothetical protein
MGRWKYAPRKIITTALGDRVIQLSELLEGCCGERGAEECLLRAECTDWWDRIVPWGRGDFSAEEFIELLGQFELRRQQLRKVSKSSEMSHAQKEVLGAGVERGW